MMVPLGTKGGKSALIRLTPLSEQSPICFIIFNRLSPAGPKQEGLSAFATLARVKNHRKSRDTKLVIRYSEVGSVAEWSKALLVRENKQQKKDPGFDPGLDSLYKMF